MTSPATERGYEIRRVVGITETGSPINNSAFTNMAAAVVLRETTGIARALQLPYREWRNGCVTIPAGRPAARPGWSPTPCPP